MRLLVTSVLAFGLVGGAAAQTDVVQHHHFSVGICPAIPTVSSQSYLGAAPMVDFHYGYRFNRYLQADAGVQLAWGAANNQNAVITDLDQVQGGDHEYMVPLGGRVILPLLFKRMEFSAGGGAPGCTTRRRPRREGTIR